MKNKTRLILLATLSATVLLFNGCGKEEPVPVVSEPAEVVEPVAETESVEEVESTETVEPEEPVEEESAIEYVPMTEEEIEEFKATATGALKNNIDRYEKIKANGSYTDSDGTVWDKVVGTPGDTSWRKMTDEQAQQILATADPSSNEYSEAKAELQGANWSMIEAETGTVYFDYYEWAKWADAQVQERLNSAEQKIIDNAVMNREQNPEEWDEMMGGDIKN